MSGNIIEIDVPNGVSILIMGAVGALILCALRKLAMRSLANAGNDPMANRIA